MKLSQMNEAEVIDMKKLLGKIVDSFTMPRAQRVILLDRDCSADLKSGDIIEVKLSGDKVIKTVVEDALLEDGTPFGITGEKVASLSVPENENFTNENVIGCEVYLA
ncbi:MAG: hypothetical protein NTV72_00525 [Candidatus Taylorbacteria bacterium]|nr:hypothetical protein [Candidatus Taylorbacteria bacterium]